MEALFVTICSFIDIVMAVGKHTVNEDSQFASHGENGYRPAVSAGGTPITGAQRTFGVAQGQGTHPQNRGDATGTQSITSFFEGLAS